MEHQPRQSNGDEQHPEITSDHTVHPEQPAKTEQANAAVEQEPRHRPRIYVADLASMERGSRRGLWIDANQAADALDADIAAMLDSSPTIGAEAWAVRDSHDFAGLDLSAVTDTSLISRLARGIAEHGAAFAAWVQLVGNRSDRLDQFEEAYVASYDSAREWAHALADSLGWHRQLDRNITDPLLRPYVVIDYDAMIRDSGESWDVVGGVDGKTHVFVR